MTTIVTQTLDYDEQLILATYKRIFTIPYNASEADQEKIACTHIESQQIGYFLSTIHLLTDYCFNWNAHGPFSSAFESLLSDLDSKSELADNFSKENPRALLCVLLSDCLLESVNTLCDSLSKFVYADEKEHKNGHDYQPNTLELPGSLLYIAETAVCGPKFEFCSTELKLRRKIFSDDEKNKLAWKCLADANLLKL